MSARWRMVAIVLSCFLAAPASAAPRMSPSGGPFPYSPVPQVLCLYYQGLDRILQVYITDGNAIHLDPSNESHTGRWIDPEQLALARDSDPMNRCDILYNADQVNIPTFTAADMMRDHYDHMRYELEHRPELSARRG